MKLNKVYLLLYIFFVFKIYAYNIPGGDLPSIIIPGKEPSFFQKIDPFQETKLFLNLSGRITFIHERNILFSFPQTYYNNSLFPDFNSFEISYKVSKYLLLSFGSDTFRLFDRNISISISNSKRTFFQKGALRSWNLTPLIKWQKSLYAGFTANYLYGNITTKSIEEYTDTTTEFSSTFKLQGFLPEFFTGLMLFKKIFLTGFIFFPAEVYKDKTDILKYPLETGLQLKTLTENNSFFCEAKYSAGSSFTEKNSEEFTPYNFRDTISILAGFSASSKTKKSLYRLTWLYQPLMYDRYSDRISVFLSGLFVIESFNISIDLEWAQRIYRGDGIFFDADSLINEHIFRLIFGLSYAIY